MPRYGPWITPPTQTLDIGWSAGFGSIWGVMTLRQLGPVVFGTVDFATSCETGGSVTPDTGGIRLTSAMSMQGRLLLPFDVAVANLTDYSGYSLPFGASGVDYDPSDPPAASWMTHVDAVLALSAQSFADAADFEVRADPSWIAGTDVYLAGADLSGYTLIGSGHVSASGLETQVGVAVSFPASDVVAVGGSYQAYLRLNYVNQRTHVVPASETSLGVSTSIGTTATVTYQPRRYRFVYSDIPLRQAQRGDGLAGGTARATRDRSVLATNRARAASYL